MILLFQGFKRADVLILEIPKPYDQGQGGGVRTFGGVCLWSYGPVLPTSLVGRLVIIDHEEVRRWLAKRTNLTLTSFDQSDDG